MYALDNSSKLPNHSYEAETIGNIALEVLSDNQEGYVFGKTSRGLFIKSSSKWLIFVSREPFRSPLTINIRKNADLMSRIYQDMPIRISDSQLVFPKADSIISPQNSSVWCSAMIKKPSLLTSDRYQRLASAATVAMTTTSGDGLDILISKLINNSEYDHKTKQTLSSKVERVNKYLETKPKIINSELTNILISLLGYGVGLTPSGDDFVIGFLLALNRWKEALLPDHSINEINRKVTAAAYMSTTTLSANLIECASHGEGDERLIAAIDWLMGGVTLGSESIKEMLGWGNSSGSDVLTGFMAVLTLQTDIDSSL